MKCQAPGCTNPVRARRLCNPHLQQLYRNGYVGPLRQPAPPKPEVRHTPPPRALPGSWAEKAACKKQGDVMFPDSNGYRREADERRAKAICAECPVLVQCRAWALEAHETYGIAGGLTPKERRFIHQQRATA